MKLYYSPGACSLSPHIVLHELGLPCELERVDAKAGRTEAGADYRAINPKSQVPALRLDDGAVLTEGTAIVQYLAALAPGEAGPTDPLERARLHEQLNFIASELHKAFAPLFARDTSEAARAAARTEVARRLDHVERQLSDGRPHLLGDTFTVADAYLFAVTRWTAPTAIALTPWPHLAAYMQRLGTRPSVRAALAREGLS